MQPKNLREKWGMKHFWKYISPKSVLLNILCSKICYKRLSICCKRFEPSTECWQKRTNKNKDTKINAGSQVTRRCALWSLYWAKDQAVGFASHSPISTSSASLVLQRINPKTSKQKASRSKVSIGKAFHKHLLPTPAPWFLVLSF